jgi:biopolymer transport protein ExbD
MRQRRPMDSPEIPIAPMIDCVFLMLVYFMTTSSLDKSEADLACPSGQAGMAADPLEAVDEQQLSVTSAGMVMWNGSSFDLLDSPGGRSALQARLQAFSNTCQQSGSEPSLRVQPQDEAPHQALVTLLDAVTLAGIESIHFP